jgi:hypothetical protein
MKYKIYVNNFSFSVQSATFQTIELENSSNRLDLSVYKVITKSNNNISL